MRYQRAEPPLSLSGLTEARRFFAGCFAELPTDRETLVVAHVDGESRCLHVSRHAGDANGADMPYRTILGDALRHGSAGIILAHNHPSGDAAPSNGDRQATRKLALAGEAIDLTIVDHLIFAGRTCQSFRQMGLL